MTTDSGGDKHGTAAVKWPRNWPSAASHHVMEKRYVSHKMHKFKRQPNKAPVFIFILNNWRSINDFNSFLVGPTQHPEETWNQTVINFLISPINRCRTLWDVLKVIFQQYSTVFSIRPPKQLSFPNISTRFIVLKQYSTSLARQHYNECWKCWSMESLGLYTTLPSAHPQCAAWTTVHLWKRCWCNSGWMRSPCHFEHLL